MRYDKDGRELPDSTPVEMPLHFNRPKPLNQLVQELIRTEFSRQAEAEGKETFEEANDFEVEDEEMPYSPHELLDDDVTFAEYDKKLLDKAQAEEDNRRTVDKDGKPKEMDNVRERRVESDSSGAVGAREKRVASSGKRRSAGDGGDGVSKGGGSTVGADEESSD